jgi:hypothetical protein
MLFTQCLKRYVCGQRPRSSPRAFGIPAGLMRSAAKEWSALGRRGQSAFNTPYTHQELGDIR